MNGRRRVSRGTAAEGMEQRGESGGGERETQTRNHFYENGGRWIIGGVPVLSATPAIVRNRARNGRRRATPPPHHHPEENDIDHVRNDDDDHDHDDYQLQGSSDMETHIDDMISMETWRDDVEYEEDEPQTEEDEVEEEDEEEEDNDGGEDEHRRRGLPTVENNDGNEVNGGDGGGGDLSFSIEPVPVQHVRMPSHTLKSPIYAHVFDRDDSRSVLYYSESDHHLALPRRNVPLRMYSCARHDVCIYIFTWMMNVCVCVHKHREEHRIEGRRLRGARYFGAFASARTRPTSWKPTAPRLSASCVTPSSIRVPTGSKRDWQGSRSSNHKSMSTA